jgi:SprT-like family
MRTLRLFLLLCISAIPCCAASDHNFESHQDIALQSIFDEINQGYFAGNLQKVEVRWANLKTEEARGVTRFYDEGSFLIEIDRKFNPSFHKASITLYHEACHVATHAETQQQDPSNVHGAAFQDCMRRFPSKGALRRFRAYLLRSVLD